MDTKKLRQKILDLAIHGKLVPQDPNDEPASVLLERIHAEKEALIKEGKIKRTKKTIASDTSHYENMPFDVPEGWCWIRLKDIASFGGGKTPSMENKEYWDNGTHLWVTSKDMKTSLINDSMMKISDEALKTMQVYQPGTLLMVTRSGILRRMLPLAILGEKATVNQDLKTISIVAPILPIYVFYAILANESMILRDYHKDGTTVDSINFDKFVEMPIPLPPQNEQKRIVDAIEHYLFLIEDIKHSEDDILVCIDSAKSKILDLAIHGKLVPQDPTDEPASELLKRINPKAIITGDNPHYTDLPRGWVILKGKDLFKPMKSTKPSGETFKYIDIDSINNKNGVVTAPKILKSSDAPSRATRFTVKGDIVFSMVRPYLRNIAIVPENGCIASTGFYVCSPNGVMSSDYCYYLMTSNYVVEGLNKYMKGDNSPSINNNHINEWLFPVPPLKEQLRIVSKLQDILSPLDSIMSSLQA